MDVSRTTALNILIEFDKSGTFPNLSLKKHLRDIGSKRDAAFITALVYGVIEKKITLDYYISKVSSVKLKKINVCVINILRLGLYQIMFMSTPHSAACNTSVELAKKNGQYKSASFVNAILRKLSQCYNNIELPTDRLDYLSVKYSVGMPVLNKLYQVLNDDVEAYLSFDHKKDLHIAVNTTKVTTKQLVNLLKLENIDAYQTDFDGLLKIKDGFDVENSSAFKNGLFHVIGLASYIVSKTTVFNNCQSLIDMCSAPGGKTFSICYSYNDNIEITAFDLHQHKINNLQQSCKRLGLNNVFPFLNDGTVLNAKYIGTADCVLCDVPCSGLGVINNKPDIKYNDIDFDSLIEIQYKILGCASSYLKSGGRLVYSTCTINPDENQNQIKRFLNEHTDFEIEDNSNVFNLKNEYTFLPHKDKTDGFYYCVLKKK